MKGQEIGLTRLCDQPCTRKTTVCRVEIDLINPSSLPGRGADEAHEWIRNFSLSPWDAKQGGSQQAKGK
jgi:hypothetical protein